MKSACGGPPMHIGGQAHATGMKRDLACILSDNVGALLHVNIVALSYELCFHIRPIVSTFSLGAMKPPYL